MKKIILFLYLFHTFVYAEHNLTMPEGEILDNARLVSLKDWSKVKKPLQILLKNEGKEYIEAFLQIAKKPYEPTINIDDVPHLILTRDHYTYAIAYIKYLENFGENDKSIDIYNISLKGLHTVTPTKRITLLGLVYRTVIENMINKSIFHALDSNIYTKANKEELLQIIQNNTILSTEIMYAALENERKSIMYTLTQGYIELFKKLQNSKKPTNIIFKEMNRDEWLIYQEDLISSLLQHINTKYVNYNQLFYDVNTQDDADIIHKKIEDNKNKFNTLYDQPMYDIKKSLIENKKYKVQVLGNYIFYNTVGKFYGLKLDLLENIKFNQELIQKLKTR